MARRSPRRRWLRALVWTLVALLVAVCLPFIIALHPAGRRFIVDRALAVANANLDYELDLERLDRLDPWGVELRGVELFERHGAPLVRVDVVSIRLRPRDLVRGIVHARRIEIAGVVAHLPEGTDEEPEQEPEPSTAEPQKSTGSTLRVLVDELIVRDAALDTQLSDRRLHAVVKRLQASGQYGAHPAAAISALEAYAELDGDRVAVLHTRDGSFDPERGGALSVDGEIAGAPLSLEASIGPLPTEDRWPTGKLALGVRRVTRRTLERLGVSDGAKLEKTTNLTLEARSLGTRFDVRARVHAGRSQLRVHGSLDPDLAEVDVMLSPTHLRSWSGLLPDVSAAGDVTVRYDLRTHPTPLAVSWRRVRYEQRAVPNGSVQASLDLPIVRLDRVTIAGLERALSIRGEVDTKHVTGRAHVSARDVDLSRFAWLFSEPLGGTLTARINASLGEHGRLGGKGSVTLTHFTLGSTRLRTAGLDYELSGSTERPRGRIELGLADLNAGGRRIDTAAVGGRITPTQADLGIVLRGPDTAFTADVVGARPDASTYDVRAQGAGRVLGQPVELGLDARVRPKDRSQARLSARAGDQTLAARAELRHADDRVSAEIDAQHIDLATWTELVGAGPVRGLASVSARVEGTRKEPRGSARVLVRDLTVSGQAPVQAALAVNGDLVGGRASVELTLRGDDGLHTDFHLAASLPGMARDPTRALLEGRYDGSLQAVIPSQRLVHVGGEKIAALRGVIETTLEIAGTLDEPDASGRVVARLSLPARDGDEVKAESLNAAFDVRADGGTFAVYARDGVGDLLRLDGQVGWPGGSLRSVLSKGSSLQLPPFRLRGRLWERQLDQMQGVYAYLAGVYALDVPIRLRADVDLRGDGSHVDGELHTRALLRADQLDARCAMGAVSQVDVDAALARDEAQLTLVARAGDQGRVEAKVTSPLAFGDEPALGPAVLTARGTGIRLPQLPGLCDLAGGEAAFTLRARALGDEPPEALLELGIDGLRAGDDPPLGMHLFVAADDSHLRAQGDISVDRKDAGQLRAAIPLAYGDGSTPSIDHDGPIDARLVLRDVPLAAWLSFGEQLNRPRGHADASLVVTGTLSDPRPRGTIELRNAGFSIASLAQPIRGLNGRIQLDGREVVLEKLVMRDRGGKLELNGKAKLAPNGAASGTLELRADDFPVRRQGLVVGELTTRTVVDAEVDEKQRVSLDVRVGGGRVWLTGAEGRDVQPLKAHPQVHFLDEPEEQKTLAQKKAEGDGLTLAILRLHSSRDVWLMHRDFSVEVGFDIGMTMEGDEPKLEGEAEIRRGQLTLLGKSFRIEEGVIRMTGAIPPDPELDLRAVYEPPSGEAVIVEVTGPSSQPQLAFSGGATNIGEAVAVLTGAGRAGAEVQAQDEARNFALGVTAGLLSVAARRRFGEWVPMISIENDPSGAPTRARAGFDASKLIPHFLRGIARGAYVEGIVGSEGTEMPGGSGTVGLGVRIEVALPYDFVSTVGYGPGPRWGADIAWSP